MPRTAGANLRQSNAAMRKKIGGKSVKTGANMFGVLGCTPRRLTYELTGSCDRGVQFAGRRPCRRGGVAHLRAERHPIRGSLRWPTVAVPHIAPPPAESGTPNALPGEGTPRLMQRPTVSRTHIAFDFAGEIWIVPRGRGGEARRLVTGQLRQRASALPRPTARTSRSPASTTATRTSTSSPAAGGEPLAG